MTDRQNENLNFLFGCSFSICIACFAMMRRLLKGDLASQPASKEKEGIKNQ